MSLLPDLGEGRGAASRKLRNRPIPGGGELAARAVSRLSKSSVSAGHVERCSCRSLLVCQVRLAGVTLTGGPCERDAVRRRSRLAD